MLQSQENGMSRIERCNLFSSIEKEEAYFQQKNISSKITKFHSSIIDKINNDDILL